MADAEEKEAFLGSILASCREQEIAVVMVAAFNVGTKMRRQIRSNLPDESTQQLLRTLVSTDGHALEQGARAMMELSDPESKWGDLSDERKAEYLALVRVILTAATGRASTPHD